MKTMKIIVLIVFVLLMGLQVVVPAAAVTTGGWDLGKARKSIDTAITDLIRQEQETEPEDAEYAEYEDAATDEAVSYRWPDRMFRWFGWMGEWK